VSNGLNKKEKIMNQLSGNEMMSYNAGNLMAGGTSVYGQNAVAANTYDCFYYYYPQWYPSYHCVQERSKVEQAFKIVGKLLEKDLIEKELTVKQFMKLVNEIAEII
jgi:hypothetical protein